MDANGNSAPGVECWMYLYVFGGSSAEPSFNANPEGDGVPAESLANIICNGTVDAEHTLIETEVLRKAIRRPIPFRMTST